MMEHMKRMFRSTEVLELAGLSYRRLDYWDRTGLLSPSGKLADGSGTQRLYTGEDLLVLTVVRTLMDAGIKRAVVEQAIATVRDRIEAIDRHSVLVLPLDGSPLIVDEVMIEDALAGAGGFVLPLGPVLERFRLEPVAAA